MKVYIVKAKRSAVGGFLGSLKSLSAQQIGTNVVTDILKDVDKSIVSELICGNVLSAGLGQCVARQIAINSGLDNSTTAYSVNMVCGSGLKAIMNGYDTIQNGAEVVIAGGAESMSNAPFLLPSSTRDGFKMGNLALKDSMIHDGLTDAFSGVHMGITAENIAHKYNITRSMQDEFAYASQQKAINAIDNGKFKQEIVPINVKQGKKEFVFDTDEHPNRNTTPEKLASLRPAFKEDGTVTAGNSSGLNDGSAFVMLASEEAVKKYNLTPMCQIIAHAQAGVDPQFMGLGPISAVNAVLKKANIKLSNIDLLELNEAFAVQALCVVNELSTIHSTQIAQKTNVYGGAIALGHPIGASGARILVTLIHALKAQNKALALASLCIGGGMGTSIIIKNV